MSDLISRQAAIDALKKVYWDKDIQSAKDDPCIVDAMTDWAIRQVKALPSAQPHVPDRNVGKWIYGESEIGNDGYYCSVCGNFVPWKYDEYDIDFIKEFLFCNKCGADMRPQFEEPEINPCRGCEDYDGKGGCKSKGGCAGSRGEQE